MNAAPDRCDVWMIDLDAPCEESVCIQWLDSSERGRWQRFRLALHRRRYLVAHALMRRILGGYLGLSPQEVSFDVDGLGRPRLACASRQAGALDFNLSHSEGIALLAVARTGPIGVDVEVLRAVPDAHELAGRYFAPGECARMQALTGPAADAAFLTCWTRKEAVLKSLGVGLRIDPSRLEVGPGPGESLVSVNVSNSDTALRVRSFELAERAVGACATPRQIRTLRMCELSRQLPQPFC